MNVLFLTMNVFTDIEMHNIYSDLMKEFIKHGHRPYIVTPREKKLGEKTELIDYSNYSLLKVQIGNTSGVSLVEKGVSTIRISSQFYQAVNDKLGNLNFGLILYSTPPITIASPVAKFKKLFHCKTYLMLKDIFPQNAIDLEMFSKTNPVYWYFRYQEKYLYRVSDRIGCMSPANVKYILEHNPEIQQEKVDLCPNAIIPKEDIDHSNYKKQLRDKLSIPEDAIVLLYGGNLGKPQAIPFFVECLKRLSNDKSVFTVICGSGSDFRVLQSFIQAVHPTNMILMEYVPNQEYQAIAKGCDAGIIMLDSRFSIPNFPSRLLSYLENSMPVLVCTDSVTDIGKISESNGFGISCSSNSVDSFCDGLSRLKNSDLYTMGLAARKYLEENYHSKFCYKNIMDSVEKM